ncbi:uncharacterized protein LOC113498281 [Trichoplusia ni]|uniref:Uncharacterized protein LOC113498281 n=1 Tax=Trichoplusia ni TaxID=7111 RepID=A0A7E5W156_TRINI|nr:uncharacterized protein LOC113498281 [Trichoplusia ni]
MKLFGLLVCVMAVLALIMGGASAEPKGIGKVIKKGGKIIKAGIGAIGAIGTGHEVYEHIKNRG